MRTAAEMKEYFSSIGFTLVKGCFNSRGKGGWTLGPTQNFPSTPAPADWPFSIHFPTLREVERGWGCTAASLFTDMDIMRKLLVMYKTAPTHELESIADWAENMMRNGGGTACEFESPNVPGWLSTQMKNQTYWSFGEVQNISDGYTLPILERDWKKKAKQLYSRYYKKSGSCARATLDQRIAWLCRRACVERLRGLPKAHLPSQALRRL